MTDNLGSVKDWDEMIVSDLKNQLVFMIDGKNDRAIFSGEMLESDYGFYVKYFVKKDGK